MSSSSRKRTSSSRPSASVKDVGAAGKRRAKKWSKGKARQKQDEVDSQRDAVYQASILSPVHVATHEGPQQDSMAAVNALEETLRAL